MVYFSTLGGRITFLPVYEPVIEMDENENSGILKSSE